MAREVTRGRGALEREVVASLAAAGRPLTAAEVLSDLGGDLAYTTVTTTLARLHSRGALNRRPAGRAYAYSLDGDAGTVQTSMTAHQMHVLLDAGTDRAGVLARFVADLDRASERLLVDLLATDAAADADLPRSDLPDGILPEEGRE